VRAELLEINLIEQQTSSFQSGVMTWDAVLIDDGALSRGIRAGGIDGRCCRGSYCGRRRASLTRHDNNCQYSDPDSDQKVCSHAARSSTGYFSSARGMFITYAIDMVRLSPGDDTRAH